MKLPGWVVREKILNFLNNPQDLLNLLIAIPTEEEFAPLTKEELEFDLKFPETSISSGEPIWDNDHQLRQLSLRSDHHRKVLLRQFEHFLVNDISNTERISLSVPNSNWSQSTFYRSISIDSVVRSMEGMALKEWNKFPVTSRVVIYIGGDYKPEGVGSSIWHAEICIRRRKWVAADLDLEPFWRNVCGSLENMSNLRNLHLRHVFKEIDIYGDGDDQHFQQVGPVQLPELPFLKSINFHETKFNNADTFRMFKMLLDKYGDQLNQLGFTLSWPLDENNTQFPVDLSPCQNLSLLSFIDQSVYANRRLAHPSSGMVLRFMSNFREARLKKIRLSLNDSNSLKTLYRLLVYMSRTFGNSLEHLEFEFGQIGWENGMEAPSPTLLMGVHFPKLVYFGTNLKSTRELYEAVIRFPVLETLEIGKCLWVGRDKACCNLEGGKLLQCWTEQIWKELPRLKWIGYYKNWYKEEENNTLNQVEENRTGKVLRFVNFCKNKIQSCFGRWA